MTNLVAAAVILLLTHLGVSSTQLRGYAIARLGEPAYLVAYSLVSVAALGWLVVAFALAEPTAIRARSSLAMAVPFVILPPGLLLLVGSLSAPNPTALGQTVTDLKEPARGVLRITRHPMMWGIGLWSLAHLVAATSDTALVLFSALAALALVGTLAIDAKKRAAGGWEDFLHATSNLPFLAICRGRQRIVWSEIGWWRTLAAIALYVALILGHGWLSGVRLVG